MRDLLTAGLTALDLDPAAADKLARYAELLLEKNKVMNLTAILIRNRLRKKYAASSF